MPKQKGTKTVSEEEVKIFMFALELFVHSGGSSIKEFQKFNKLSSMQFYTRLQKAQKMHSFSFEHIKKRLKWNRERRKLIARKK